MHTYLQFGNFFREGSGGTREKTHAIVQFDSAIYLIYMELEHHAANLFSYQESRTANTTRTHSPDG